MLPSYKFAKNHSEISSRETSVPNASLLVVGQNRAVTEPAADLTLARTSYKWPYDHYFKLKNNTTFATSSNDDKVRKVSITSAGQYYWTTAIM